MRGIRRKRPTNPKERKYNTRNQIYLSGGIKDVDYDIGRVW
jgi:hypothetical protein